MYKIHVSIATTVFNRSLIERGACLPDFELIDLIVDDNARS